MTSAKVAVRRVSPDRAVAGVEELLDLLDVTVSPRAVLATTGDDASGPGSVSTPWQVEGVLRRVAGQVRLAAPGHGPRWLRDRIASPEPSWVEYRPRRAMRALDAVCPDGIALPEWCFGASWIGLPTAACHVDHVVAGALALGPRPRGAKLPRSPLEVHAIAVDLLAIRREIHPDHVAVMDATTAAAGPSGDRPVVKGTLLASRDPVALDAVTAGLMGFEPMSIAAIHLAHEDRLGIGDLRDIELVGDSLDSDDWGLSPRGTLLGELAATGIQSVPGRLVSMPMRSWRRRMHARTWRSWERGTRWGRLHRALTSR